MQVIEMNQSTDQAKENNHGRNVVNMYFDGSSRKENTSRSSTQVEMTVETMNNKIFATQMELLLDLVFIKQYLQNTFQ